jgi:divalent anion:Na+ symporter, DASS family
MAHSEAHPITAAGSPASSPSRRRSWISLLALVLIYVIIAHVLPRPEAVAPAAWRLTGLFIATVVGLILQPIAGGALVLIAVTMSAVVGGLSIGQALAGYADSTVWLVMAAFFISRALINTGLARRIALIFVRMFGKHSVGVSYSLALSDMVLATIIPSNAARTGGVILPIARSIAELYKSSPGPTATVLGSFLMTAVYQSGCITAAMFFTGQASNPLAAQIAGSQFNYPVTWLSWMVAALVPGLVSLAVIPWVVLKLNPPQVRHTPDAAAFAHRELEQMGKVRGPEAITMAVFLAVCGLWVTSGWHGIDITVTALLGAAALLVTRVVDWEDIKSERAAWDIFIWYGGLLRLGRALNEGGVTTEFANWAGGMLSGFTWMWLLGAALVIYFYAHYIFASITAHILAMYAPFMGVLVAAGAPVGLVVFAFAFASNLSAGLTHYGTTPAPMFFGQGYASLGTWWRVGFVCSVVNLLIWATIGFGWWKLIGLW